MLLCAKGVNEYTLLSHTNELIKCAADLITVTNELIKCTTDLFTFIVYCRLVTTDLEMSVTSLLHTCDLAQRDLVEIRLTLSFDCVLCPNDKLL